MYKNLFSLISVIFFTVVISEFSYAQQASVQPGQWTWASGSNQPNQPNIYGTKGETDANNAPGARTGAAQWVDNAGNLWLMGGLGRPNEYATEYLNDLWKYSPSTGLWTWVNGGRNIDYPSNYGTKGVASASNMPGARMEAFTWKDNAGNLWLMGGYGSAASITGYLNDLWKYNIATGEWTWMSGANVVNQTGVYGTISQAAAANTPGSRRAATTWTDASGNLWLFGGYGYNAGLSGSLNDVWKYTVSTGLWSWMKGSDTQVNVESNAVAAKGVSSAVNVFGGRSGAVAWVDLAANMVYIMGGERTSPAGTHNDLWAYRMSFSTWVYLDGPVKANSQGIRGAKYEHGNFIPSSRKGAIAWKEQNNLWLQGGMTRDSLGNIKYNNDLWKYNLALQKWFWMGGSDQPNATGIYGTKGIAGADNMPGARTDAISWLDQSGRFWMFGGGKSGTPSTKYNDLWVYKRTYYPRVSPTVAASNINFSGTTKTSATIKWKNGNGVSRLVFVGEISNGIPSASLTPIITPNTSYRAGSLIPVGWYCVYKGADSSVSITGLQSSTMYKVAVLEYNSNTDSLIYSTTRLPETSTGWLSTLEETLTTTSGQWTWVNGSSAMGAYNQYGTKGVSSPTTTPGSRKNAATWKDKNGNMWLFGGVNPIYGGQGGWSIGAFNDLWKLDAATGHWTFVSGTTTVDDMGTRGVKGAANASYVPGARYGAAAWVDNDGNLWLFGGWGGSGDRYGALSDMWKYNVTTGLWAWMGGLDGVYQRPVYGTKGVAASKNIPSGRKGASGWADNDGNLWLFGGDGFDAFSTSQQGLNDLWKYNIATGFWTWVGGSNKDGDAGSYGEKTVPSASNMPRSRIDALSWKDADGNFWLFGGLVTRYGNVEGGSYLNDLWKFNPTSGQWSWMNGSSEFNDAGQYVNQRYPQVNGSPSSRWGGVAWQDKNNNVWIFGGQSYASAKNSLSDLWKYNPATNQWTWVSGTSLTDQFGTYGTKRKSASQNYPNARQSAMAWTDTTGKFWLFGGSMAYFNNPYHNDLWQVDPAGIVTYSAGKPTVAATPASVQLVDTTHVIKWKKGNGMARAVFVIADTVRSIPLVRDYNSYIPNTAYGKGINYSNWYCVYTGTDTTVTITNLPFEKVCRVAVFEYNNESNQYRYYFDTVSSVKAFPTSAPPLTLAEGQWTWAKGLITALAPVFAHKDSLSVKNELGSRSQAATWTDKAGNRWLFGGNTVAGYAYNDLWMYDIQKEQWIWKTGSSVNRTKGVYGTLGVPDVNNTPGTRYNAATWVDNNGDLWLMGGVNQEDNSVKVWNDLWRYNIASGMWTWMSGSNNAGTIGTYGVKGVYNATNVPNSRHSVNATWVDTDGNLCLMGGTGSGAVFNDIWKFNITTMQWVWIGGSNVWNASGEYGTLNVEAESNSPGARSRAVSWKDKDGNIWIFGGNGYAKARSLGNLNDLWRLNTGTNKWTWMGGPTVINAEGNYGVKNKPSKGNLPSARIGSVGWTDKNGNLWLFGSSTYHNDLWMYNTGNQTWTWVNGSNLQEQRPNYGIYKTTAATNMPGGLTGAATWVDKDGNFVLYGGYGYPQSGPLNYLATTWMFKPNAAYINSIQASNIKVFDIGFTQAKISFTKGNGQKRVVFIKAGNSNSAALRDSVSYTANAEFLKGAQIEASGWYCVYNGADSVFTVNGLAANTTYQIFVAEYIEEAGYALYNTATANDNLVSFATSPVLASLATSKGILSPEFSPTQLNYNLNLPLGSTAVNFKPVIDTNNTSAIVKIQDKITASGALSDTIVVRYGTNIIPVSVTVGEQTTTYNVTVKVGLFAPQITFAALPVKTYGDAAFEPVATSENTGVPVVFATSDNQVAQIVNGKIKVIRDGTVRITASQIAGNGYDAAVPVTQAFTVNKAQLIVKAKDKSRVYGIGNGTLSLTYTGFVNGDTQAKLTGGLPVASVNADASSPVGTYEITPVVNNSYFYELVPEPGTLTITKAPLTVTTEPATRFYGAANPVMVLKYTGFANNDGASKLTVRPTATIQADALSVPGKYAVTVDGGEAQNYDFTYVPGTITINKANLFITAKSRLITYGDDFPSLVLTYSGFVNGERAEQAFNTMPVVTTTASSSSPAGTYPITVSGAASSKYILYYTNGTFTINKAVLRVTARNQTREQYQSNPEFTLRYSGFVNGDTESMLRTIPQGYTAATENSPVGQYAINASGGYSPYYTFNYTAGVLAVTKATTPSFARTSSTPDDIVVHAAVSPNGDGQNDYWQIDNIEKYAENQVMILTNAGTLVYEAKGYDNYNKRFDGYSSGARVKQQPGTYMYVINYIANGEQKKKTGYLVLK